MTSKENRPDGLTLIQLLAQASTTQTGVANRRWLALMTVAVVALLPRDSSGGENLVELPFSFGRVDPSTFYLVAFLMLLALTIGFAAAHAQSFRSNVLAQDTISKMTNGGATAHGVPLRDVYDMLRLAGITQVSPLSRLLGSDGSAWHRWIGAFYYLVLKTMSVVIYFGFPATALLQVYLRLDLVGPWRYLLEIGGLVATVPLVQIFVRDVMFMGRIFRIIAVGQGKDSGQSGKAR